MATQIVFRPPPPAMSHKGRAALSNAFRAIALLIGLLLTSISARAQFQQPFVFAINAAFTPGAAPGASTSASISSGQTAQYLLQLNPGPGFSGTVSLACAGAPLYAIRQVPASVAVVNGAQVPFTVSVMTAGAARLPPSIPWRFVPPVRIHLLVLLATALLLLASTRSRGRFDGALRARRLVGSAVLTVILFCSFIYAAGCGSSAGVITTTPPPTVTPSSTSSITISMSAMSPTQQPLQLPPIQLTLTVK